jgi:hypothetical protein
MKITFSIVAFFGVCMAFFGLQGILSFSNSIQSKTDAKVVAVGTQQMPKYSLVKIWVLEPNGTDTLTFTQHESATVGETVSIWNVAENWIKPFWLRGEQEQQSPPREVFAGWLRHDSGLGIFFFLMGTFLMAVSTLSILRPKGKRIKK